MSILIFSENNDTFNNPSLDAFFKICNNRKIKIFIFCIENLFECKHPNVSVYKKKQVFIYGNNKHFKRLAKHTINKILDLFQIFHLLKIILFDNPILSIAIDSNGLKYNAKCFGLFKCFFKNIKKCYWSFEIEFKNEGANKYDEIKYSNDLDIVLIQDDYRFELLNSENNFNDTVRIYKIPVAPLLSKVKKSTNFKSRYGLNENKVLAVIGTFTDWTGSKIIFDLLEKGLPDNWVIFLNSRFLMENNLKIKLNDYNSIKRQIIINDNYIDDIEELFAILNELDCGFCFYLPNFKSLTLGKNISNIGLSSGKFSLYALANLPIVFNSNRYYSNLNQIHSFGYEIENNVDQLYNVLLSINSKLSHKKDFIDLFNVEDKIAYFLNKEYSN